MVNHKRTRHNVTLHLSFKVRKNGQQKTSTCFATLLQNDLNNDVARYTTQIKPVLLQIRLLTGLNMGGKTRNIAIQLVLQQCCKTSCTFFVARLSTHTKSATILTSEFLKAATFLSDARQSEVNFFHC